MQTSSGSTSAARPVGVAAASMASYSSPSAPSGVTSMTCSTLVQLVADLVDARPQLRADDQHLGAGVVEHVVELVGGQPEVDDRVGRAQRGGGEGQLDAGRVVLVEERDDVAAPDAQFGQRAGQPADPVVPLRPGPGPVQVGHRLVIGLGLRPVGQPVVEEPRIGQVGGLLVSSPSSFARVERATSDLRFLQAENSSQEISGAVSISGGCRSTCQRGHDGRAPSTHRRRHNNDALHADHAVHPRGRGSRRRTSTSTRSSPRWAATTRN